MSMSPPPGPLPRHILPYLSHPQLLIADEKIVHGGTFLNFFAFLELAKRSGRADLWGGRLFAFAS